MMTRLPQVLVNVPGVDKSRADTDPTARGGRLGRRRRNSAILAGSCCDPSGTESLVRVMVEAETLEQANSIAQRLADVVKSSLAL